jgi:hypothetical protein
LPALQREVDVALSRTLAVLFQLGNLYAANLRSSPRARVRRAVACLRARCANPSLPRRGAFARVREGTDMPDFNAIRVAFDQIEGMTGVPSAQIFDALLTRQAGGPPGDLMEIGAYKGKSAIILAHHLRPGERLELVDVEPYLEKIAFVQFGDAVQLRIGDSDDLAKLVPNYSSFRKKVRFLHTDASHTFDNVTNDIAHANRLVSDEGVLVVDDYENRNFPQVPLAVGSAIYGAKADFRVFLVANNKAYLCRRKVYQAFRTFVVNTLAPVLYADHGMVLALTDPDAPIALRDREGDDGPVFGEHIYRHWIEALRK